MTDRRDHGGFAFPVVHKRTEPFGVESAYSYAPGMTLRDYFAARALQMIGAPKQRPINDQSLEEIRTNARVAYAIADAMLVARDA
jgi:hypothetical protein